VGRLRCVSFECRGRCGHASGGPKEGISPTPISPFIDLSLWGLLLAAGLGEEGRDAFFSRVVGNHASTGPKIPAVSIAERGCAKPRRRRALDRLHSI
jgi:hypothetical protein